MKLNTALLTSSNYNDTSAPAGATSWYHITAVDNVGNESVATTTSGVRTPDTTPPATPSGVVANGSTAGIALDWADNTESDLGGYNVYSSSSVSGTFTKINGALLTASELLDAAAAGGVTTFYRVTAVDTSGNESAFVAISGFRPDSVAPNAPADLVATPSYTEVTLNWSDSTEIDFAGYNVYRSTAGDGIFTLISSGLLTASDFVDAAAPAGVASFYRVTAVDLSGNESAPAAVEAFRPNVGANGNDNGIAYDSSGVLHFAYYDTVAKTVKYATRSTSGAWSAVQTVDTSGADVGGHLSLALDATGRPAIAYFDGSGGDLRYAVLQGTHWDVQVVDYKHSVGLFPSLRFDDLNQPVIAYYKKTSGDLRLAFDNGTNWTIMEIQTEGDVGRSASLARQVNGLWAIGYENSTLGQLQYAYQDASAVWQKGTVDTSTAGISYISLAFDTSGRASMSYQETGLGDLKFAVLKNGKWSKGTIAGAGSVGQYSRLVFGGDGFANVFYYNRTTNSLVHARGYLGNWTLNELHTGGGRYIATAMNAGGQITYSWLQSGLEVLAVTDM